LLAQTVEPLGEPFLLAGHATHPIVTGIAIRSGAAPLCLIARRAPSALTRGVGLRWRARPSRRSRLSCPSRPLISLSKAALRLGKFACLELQIAEGTLLPLGCFRLELAFSLPQFLERPGALFGSISRVLLQAIGRAAHRLRRGTHALSGRGALP
jgi:hypothetical protein